MKKLPHHLCFSLAKKITKKPHRRVLPQERLSVLEDPDFDCFAETGLFYDQFLNIHEQVKEGLAQPWLGRISKTVSLASDVQLLLVLNFL